MLQKFEEREVETGGITQSTTFKIAANGKAFKVLIDGLYSNKIKACIRELWTNAYDAHLMVGKGDVPFTCQLPTRFDPLYRVRDFGISMTHDQIMNLYSTVFESTKDGDNDQVGKLGLGSKSPFAYTDTFSVTAFMDGVKRMYSAYIGTDGIPMIALLGEAETDEPDGLEVSFPVQEKDISDFIRAAHSVALGFETLPNLEGTSDKLTVREALQSGKGWVINKKEESYYDGKAMARQGCVLYPLDAAPFEFDQDDQLLKEMFTTEIVIDFPIGSLEIAASREGLGYDDDTKANILKRLEEVKTDMISFYDDEIAKLKTLFDKQVFRDAIHKKKAHLPPSLFEEVHKSLTHGGKKIKNIKPRIAYGSHNKREAWKLNAPGSHRTPAEIDKMKALAYKHTDFIDLAPDAVLMVFLIDDSTEDYVKHESAKMRMIYDELVNSYRKRPTEPHNVDTWVDSGLITAPLTENADMSKDVVMFRCTPGSWKHKKLLTLLGRPRPDQMNIIWTKDIGDLPASAKVSTGRKPVQLKYIDWDNEDLGEIKVDAEDITYFFHMNRDDALFERCVVPQDMQSTERSMGIGSLFSTLRQAKELGWLTGDEEIVGIPASRRSVANRIEDGIDIFEFLQKKAMEEFCIEKYIETAFLKDAYSNSKGNGILNKVWDATNQLEGHRNEPDPEDGSEYGYKAHLIEGSILYEALELRSELKAYLSTDEVHRHNKVAQVFSNVVDSSIYNLKVRFTETRYFSEVSKKVLKRYQYIKAIASGINYDEQQLLIDYINDVDTQP